MFIFRNTHVDSIMTILKTIFTSQSFKIYTKSILKETAFGVFSTSNDPRASKHTLRVIKYSQFPTSRTLGILLKAVTSTGLI